MCTASAHLCCALRACSAPKLRSFLRRNSRDFVCKFLNFRAPAAANARADGFGNINQLFVDDAQYAQRFLSSAALFATRFATKTHEILVETAEVSMKFGADFAHDTRAVLAETVKRLQEGFARSARHVQCVCEPLPRLVRAFGAKIAQFCGRNSRDFACNFLDFRAPAAANARADRFENTDHPFVDAVQHAQRLLSSAVLLAARFAAKTSDFSVEIAEVSMKFGADFARDTRAALAETVQKSQGGVARPARHVHCFCEPFLRLTRAFGAKTAQFFGRNSRDFACKF